MAHLLKVLHQEDALSPSALAIVKGGDSYVLNALRMVVITTQVHA